MKKKLLLTLLPLLALTGCQGTNEVASGYRYAIERGIPTIYALGDGSHTTYLMMSKYGYIDIDGVETHGVDVPEKYYENCIVWMSSANGALPTSEQVKSTVNGATFRGWAQYNDNIYPDYLTNVPSTSGQTVYAIFDGTDAGGSGGGGGGGGSTIEAYQATFTLDLAIFSGWEDIDNFSVYVWGHNGEEPLGGWNDCLGNLTGVGDIKSVTTPTIDYAIVGVILYFRQSGGNTPGPKQTTNINISITASGVYSIAPTGNSITWNNEGKMTNFTVTKIG